MLTQLLESAPRRSRRQYGILVSIAGHALALSGAVVAAHPPAQQDDPERVLLWHPPAAPPPPCTQCAPAAPTGSPNGAPSRLPSLPREPLGRLTIDVPDRVNVANPGVVIPDEEWRSGTSREGDRAGEGVVERPMVDREVVPHRGNPAPRYPDELRTAHIEGKVHARFVVDTTGRVLMETVIVDASPHPGFTRAVIEALRHARFTPAEFRGQKVPQLVAQPFVFLLREAR